MSEVRIFIPYNWLGVSISFRLGNWGRKPRTNQNTMSKISLDYTANCSPQNKDNIKYNLSSLLVCNNKEQCQNKTPATIIR